MPNVYGYKLAKQNSFIGKLYFLCKCENFVKVK